MKTIWKITAAGMIAMGLLFQSNQAQAQIFGEYQSAGLMGKGKIEASTHFTGVSTSYDGESAYTLNGLGLQAGFGLGGRFELRTRYERLWFDGLGIGDGGFNYLTLAPKLGKEDGRFAFMLPIAMAFSEGEQSFELHPTVLVSIPLSQTANLTFSPKYLISLEEGAEFSDSLLALNLGAGIGFSEQWVLRPELGLMFLPGEEGTFFNFGLGISRRMGNPKD